MHLPLVIPFSDETLCLPEQSRSPEPGQKETIEKQQESRKQDKKTHKNPGWHMQKAPISAIFQWETNPESKDAKETSNSNTRRRTYPIQHSVNNASLICCHTSFSARLLSLDYLNHNPSGCLASRNGHARLAGYGPMVEQPF